MIWSILAPSIRLDRLVPLLYRQLLGRDPRAEEMRDDLQSLKGPDLPESLQMLFQRLLNLEEAGAGLGPRLLKAPRSLNTNDQDPVKFIMSLGTHCFTSSMLERLGLRRFAGPFDWLFSNLGMIAHCLRDDFVTFLDARYYEIVPPADRLNPTVNLCQHTYYLKEFGQRFVFNHTDPTNELGYAYLNRCVQRLRAVLAEPARKLFVCVTGRAAFSEQQLADVVDALLARSARCDLLCVVVDEPVPNLLFPIIGPLERVSRAEVFALQPLSIFGGTAFEDPIDELAVARVISSKRIDLAGAP